MRHKLAAPAGLITAVVVFVGIFAFTGSLVWSPLLAVAAALGVYLMVDDRTAARVDDDTYAEDAQRRVEAALRTVRDVRRLSREVNAPAARAALEDACRYVPELLERVRATAPDSLYSTASQIGGHLESLDGAVRQYLDVQRDPVLYRDAGTLRASGEQAFQRFAEFALDSVRLVNQGDIVRYRANLETVAPPKLPELG
ncbi:hypothetical protein [Micromonospora sp. WMMD812]|uniref:hypothetical protein n=1 Tax=Micromonospora sp. WMMD812 TaxID=3015152 RepID=UPI00248AA784|nr:hypothetical protein [Micromonospora sp. WMMD812]WBB70783.1 hypothetical protein O7603_16095 [Micromonospora sp. WMMD812]